MTEHTTTLPPSEATPYRLVREDCGGIYGSSADAIGDDCDGPGLLGSPAIYAAIGAQIALVLLAALGWWLAGPLGLLAGLLLGAVACIAAAGVLIATAMGAHLDECDDERPF